MKFSVFVSLVISKLVQRLLRIFGKGATTLPGKIALFIAPDILSVLSKNVHIICVTGTNGKTTTCGLIEHYFVQNKCSYFINKGGANMMSGVATAFIQNSNIFAKCKKQYAILECDENSFPQISKHIKAQVVVVTNIFRDQLDRYFEITQTLNQIKQAILNMPTAYLVLNGDCPLTMTLAKSCPNDVYTFGTNINSNNAGISDNLYCPYCSSPLNYHSKAFAQLGNYYCSHCSNCRPQLDFTVCDLLYSTQNTTSFLYLLNGKIYNATISLGGIYNIYNYCASSLALLLLGFNNLSALSTFNGSFGRMETFSYNSHNILLLLVKNPVGLSQCISYAANIKGDFDMVFALNDNSADGTDVSWIWDADLSPILSKNSKIFTIGTRAFDMSVRLKYAGFSKLAIIDNESYTSLVNVIKKSNKDFVIFATYTSMMKMRHILIHNFGGKEFWK